MPLGAPRWASLTSQENLSAQCIVTAPFWLRSSPHTFHSPCKPDQVCWGQDGAALTPPVAWGHLKALVPGTGFSCAALESNSTIRRALLGNALAAWGSKGVWGFRVLLVCGRDLRWGWSGCLEIQHHQPHSRHAPFTKPIIEPGASRSPLPGRKRG
jgi:hypothetical protein